MFHKKRQERIMQMIQSFRPTSKTSLKQYCLLVSQGNVDEATKLYDYFIVGMEDLPIFDPIPPSWLDNTKNTVNGIVDLFKENKEGLAQVYDIFRGIMSARGKNLPAITNLANKVAEALPSIN